VINRITLDFETHYTPTYSLSKMTTQEYIADPRFEVIGLGIRWPDDKRTTWHTGAAAERQLSHLATYQDSVLAVGHNMLFDASILGHHYNIHPAGLACTMGMANVVGLGLSVGGSLAALTEAFRAAGYPLEPKGNEVVAALGKRLADFSPSELAAYGRYCCTDTNNCATFFGALRELIPDEEMLWQSQVLRMHTKPRLRIDAAVVQGELERVRARRAEAIERMRQRLGLPTFSDEELRALAASRTKLVELLTLLGVVVPTKVSPTTGKRTPALSKKDTEFLALLEHPDEMVRALVEARLEMASNIEQSRCLQLLRLAALPRFAAPYKISGAHTHRLGGDGGINLQNFPSGRKPGQSDALKRSIVPLDPDEVYVGADSSQIEVRVLDYCADDWKGLTNFRNGICPYSDMATRMWPTDGVDAALVKKLAKAEDQTWAPRRQIAKAVVLACGFGQGGPGFRDYAETQAGLVFTVEEATTYVHQYREAKPRVVAFWRRCDRVLQAMIQGEQGYFGGPDGKLFFFDGSRTVVGRHIPGIRLPNGTWLSYPGLGNMKVREVDEETGEVRWRDVVCYRNAKGRTTETGFTWGGTLTENLVQALAFAVMKWQAGGDTITRHGLVLNCHDAHAVLVPRLQAADTKASLLADMSECPPWVPGLPLGAEADVAETMAGVI